MRRCSTLASAALLLACALAQGCGGGTEVTVTEFSDVVVVERGDKAPEDQTDGSPGPGPNVAPPCSEDADEVCDGWDNDCDSLVDEGFTLACAPCGEGCIEATIAAGAWRTGIARNLKVGNDHGIALPELPQRNEHLWVSNSADNTVSKVRIKDGSEAARFIVGNNPSRTAVDGNGDAWIVMRGSESGGGPREGIIKIDGDCEPTVKPPDATWECILLDLPDKGDLLRGVAIDARGDVWSGSFTDMQVFRLDNATGIERERIDLDPLTQVYGLAIDRSGYLWVAGRGEGAAVLRIDPVTSEVDMAYTRDQLDDYQPYGLAVDGKNGIWFGTGSNAIFRIDTVSGEVGPYYTIPGKTRGVAVDDDGAIWAADSNNDRVLRFDAESGEVLADIDVGEGPVGVSVDHDGNLWTANYWGHSVSKFSPDGGDVAHFPVGKLPYTYSDMTGAAFRVFRELKGVFSASFDVGIKGAAWASLEWQGEVPPPSTVSVRVRAADIVSGLEGAEWSALTFQGSTAPIDGVVGAHIEVEVTLFTDKREAAPFIERLILQLATP